MAQWEATWVGRAVKESGGYGLAYNGYERIRSRLPFPQVSVSRGNVCGE